jgi:hypothetical protein
MRAKIVCEAYFLRFVGTEQELNNDTSALQRASSIEQENDLTTSKLGLTRLQEACLPVRGLSLGRTSTLKHSCLTIQKHLPKCGTSRLRNKNEAIFLSVCP